jgi:hypothetical protein
MSDVKIEGLEELLKAFTELPDEAVTYVEQASYPAAQTILNRARGYLTKYNDTGALSSSLKANKPSKKRKYKYVIFSKVWFGKGGKHGVPLELGHRLWYFGKKTNKDVEARPFLRPAADESKGEVISQMIGAINKALDEMGGLK